MNRLSVTSWTSHFNAKWMVGEIKLWHFNVEYFLGSRHTQDSFFANSPFLSYRWKVTVLLSACTQSSMPIHRQWNHLVQEVPHQSIHSQGKCEAWLKGRSTWREVQKRGWCFKCIPESHCMSTEVQFWLYNICLVLALQLLHDVGLVVSRCRLLGEEIHLMKKWGALRLDILDISCVDTQ